MTARPCIDFNLCFCCSGAGEIALAVVESRRYKVCVCVCVCGGGGGMGGGGGGGAEEVNTVLAVVEWADKHSACCCR